MAKAGYGDSEINPGLLLVEKVYNYCQKHHGGRTKVNTKSQQLQSQTPCLQVLVALCTHNGICGLANSLVSLIYR
jgi:hypothetical protein